MTQSLTWRARHALAVAAGALALGVIATGASAAMVDIAGDPIPNTGNPQNQLVGPPSVVQKLGIPSTPSDDDPNALAALGSPGDPEQDLGNALDAMGAAAAAGDTNRAAAQRQLALNILEGNPIDKKAYSGIPLLNWNAPAKVKSVPANGNVVVREVRWDEHAISDAWLLSFDDPSQPYTITFRITELGTTFGSLLAPAPLMEQGGTVIGGESQVLAPLAPPNLAMGTTTKNRFTPNGGNEFTRLAVQDVTVAMPPANVTDAIIEPDLKPGSETTFTLQRADGQHLNTARGDFGFSTGTPSEQDKVNAISHIGDGAPEKELWGDLRALRPDAPGFLNAAATVASGDRQLVSAMRTKSGPPAGVAHDSSANVNVNFLNDEVYLYRGDNNLPQGGSPMSIAATNADGFSHRLVALALVDKNPLGTLGWGQFTWQNVDLGGPDTLGAGESRSFNINPPGNTFALWLGDPDSGDQANAICELPTAGNANQDALACPIAFRGVGPAPAGGHVTVPDQGVAGGPPTTTTTTTTIVRPGAKPGCGLADWLTRAGRRARIGLLGLPRARMLRCLGQPTSAARRGKDTRYRYGKDLIVHVVSGKVTSFDLRTRHFVAKNKLGVGSSLRAIRKALGRTSLDRRHRVYRAVTVEPNHRFANVTVHYSRKTGKVTRIEAKLVQRKSLDRIGRRLAARAR